MRRGVDVSDVLYERGMGYEFDPEDVESARSNGWGARELPTATRDELADLSVPLYSEKNTLPVDERAAELGAFVTLLEVRKIEGVLGASDVDPYMVAAAEEVVADLAQTYHADQALAEAAVNAQRIAELYKTVATV